MKVGAARPRELNWSARSEFQDRPDRRHGVIGKTLTEDDGAKKGAKKKEARSGHARNPNFIRRRWSRTRIHPVRLAIDAHRTP